MSKTTQNEWTKKARDYILSKSQSGAYDLAGDIEDEVSDLVILLADARKEVIEEVINILTIDISDINWGSGGGRLNWEVLPNRGIEPCGGCNNGRQIRQLLATLRKEQV